MLKRPVSPSGPGRALVLGGGGFIGSALRERLASDGVGVVLLNRAAKPMTFRANEAVLNADFRDAAAVAAALEPGMDVYHLISDSTPAKGNWDVENDIHNTVLPTLALLKSAVGAGVGKIIYVSSGGTVYGPPELVPIPEDAPTEPISAYGVGKLIIEKYLALFGRLHGLDYQILRVANPYGPGQKANRQQGVVANLMHQGLTGQPFQIWGDGSVARDFINVRDVADSLVAAAAYAGSVRIMNVGSGEARSIAQVARDIESVLGLIDHPRVHHESRGFDVSVNYLDIGRIVRETAWRPRVEWRSGLAEAADWMRCVIATGED